MKLLILSIYILSIFFINKKSLTSATLNDDSPSNDCVMGQVENAVNKTISAIRETALPRKKEGHTNYCLDLAKSTAYTEEVEAKKNLTEFLKMMDSFNKTFYDKLDQLDCDDIIEELNNMINYAVPQFWNMHKITTKFFAGLNDTIQLFNTCMDGKISTIIHLKKS